MNGFRDCNGNFIPVYSKGTVTAVSSVKGAVPEGSVFSLRLSVHHKEESIPAAGQFFMLRASKTNVLLARPISVFHVERKTVSNGIIEAEIDFLILLKGKGTEELNQLTNGDSVDIIGPLGNTFPLPEDDGKVCVIGGGIGVAPVAGFAETLKPQSYDFYASYKSGSYALENINPAELVITTDDGSQGIHGMLSAAIDAEKIASRNYKTVYACGPLPMLNYVKEICAKANVKCWLSMESRMACGMGVCLGCTIQTTDGYKRCCKDGPVFNGADLIFEKPAAQQARRIPLQGEPDLSVNIGSLHMKNPVIACSGTFGFGTEYKTIFDPALLGGIASKGLTIEPRQGNSGIRVWETPSGLMNSIGLQNPGIPHFIENELPEMLKLGTAAIANLSGSSIETYVEGAKLLEKTDAAAIELNISCPNVATGGAALGMSCSTAGSVTETIRKITTKPLIVKLTPQASDVVGVAMACREAGADAISLCNSFQGVAIDIEKGRPVFDKVKAGFGGPAVRPIALRLVYETVQAMNKLPESQRIPVIGIGGIATWQDAVEFIMAGASAIEIGTATFANPLCMAEIIQGLRSFMIRKGYSSIEEMRGIAQI